MGFEVWIVILVAASALSGGIGYYFARKSAPKQSDIEALTAELEEARKSSASVASNVNEHFEQSALLFGKLAADYREFLDHFSSSAQSLGLSESRARELIEQGFQPLLTHGDEAGPGEDQVLEATAPSEPDLALDAEAVAEVADVTVEMPEAVTAEASSADAAGEQLKVEDADAEVDESIRATAASELESQPDAEDTQGRRQRSA